MDSANASIARRLIDAYDTRALIDPITTSEPGFDVADAYRVLHLIETERLTRGWVPVGRKIGFTNRTIWELYGVSGPMWARVWDRTLHRADAGGAITSISLESFVQPRIEPEVVFGLAAPIPDADDPIDLLSCVEWMAAGFEIVQCHFPGWKFAAADSTAAFGLHAALVVGPPTAVTEENRAAVAATLATFDLTLSRGGTVVGRGNGDNVLGSPAVALGFLARTVAGQPQFSAPAAGEVITTGTVTDAYAVRAGETWASDYGALGIEGLTVEFC